MLSLCMIVQNEERHIKRCLESVQGLVDEIIIVDTGSTDNTVSIAKEFGAKVYFQQWENDFSKARNESLKHASGDWILVLDADEVIAGKDHERIKELLTDENHPPKPPLIKGGIALKDNENLPLNNRVIILNDDEHPPLNKGGLGGVLSDETIVGYRFVLRNYQDKGGIANWCSVEDDCPEALGAAGYIPAYLVRLFRRGDGIIFQGVVHEVVEYSIQEKGGRIVLTDIPIHHYGRMLEQGRMEQKNKLYMEAGEKKVALNPEDARAHRDLGTQYIEMGLFKEAETALRKSVDLEPTSAHAHFNLGVAYENLGKKTEAKSCYIEALRLETGNVGASNNLAGILNEEGRFDEAKNYYENAIKENPEHYVVFFNYGILLEKVSDFLKAIECYEKALSIKPDFPDAYKRLGHVSKKLGDNISGDALFRKAEELEEGNQNENHPPLPPLVKGGSVFMPPLVNVADIHNPPLTKGGLGGVILPQPTLSLCMIVKDEEEYLPRCLESVKCYVDEIIIVDTGSTDHTVDIAKRFSAKVINHKWENDFSAARNVCLDNANGDWILVLDADEVIAEKDIKRILEIIKTPDSDAFSLILRNYEYKGGFKGWQYNSNDYEEGKGYPGYGEVPLTRLFRRNEGLRYIGKSHEVIEPSLNKLHLSIINTDIPIHHYGYVRGDRDNGKKFEYYRALGEQRIKEDPMDSKTLCDLGSHYIGDGNYLRAEQLLKQSLDIEPSRTRTHFNLGVLYAKQNNHVEALKYFTSTLELDRKDASARYNCGLMLEALGFPQEAFDQYREAISSNPEHAEAIFRLASLLKTNGYMEDAITFYRRVLEIDPDHKGAKEIVNTDKRGSIVFLNYGLDFDGDTLKEKPLGGTETAMINMAAELGKLGWESMVFNNCSRPGKYDGVEYLHYSKFENYRRDNDIDIFISVRYLEPFFTYIPAKIKILWTGDAPDQPFLNLLKDKKISENIDLIITVSKWQAEGLVKNYNISLEKVFITTNGINPGNFTSQAFARHPARIMYTSTPFRGLDILLKLFPRIKASVPDAELHVYSGMTVYQMPKEQEEKRYGDLYKSAEQPGVFLKGNVTQQELAQAMLSASVMAYPNTFQETSCISAIEAMAAGLPVVTSKAGALPETLNGVGIFIEGNPSTTEYQDSFVREVINILRDRDRWKVISEESRNRAMDKYTWDKVAKKWDEELIKRLKNSKQLAVSSKQKLEARS